MTRNRRKDLSIEEARALADKGHDMAEGVREAQQLANRFSDAGAHRVIEMWESGTNERGRPLSKFEVQALGERWVELFGCLPPNLSNARHRHSQWHQHRQRQSRLTTLCFGLGRFCGSPALA